MERGAGGAAAARVDDGDRPIGDGVHYMQRRFEVSRRATQAHSTITCRVRRVELSAVKSRSNSLDHFIAVD
jgi:hypothetical protein